MCNKKVSFQHILLVLKGLLIANSPIDQKYGRPKFLCSVLYMEMQNAPLFADDLLFLSRGVVI